MTDKKQIIINSVDVSECVHYEDLSCTAFRDSCGYPLDCKDFFFCNYKQLARKTQECEKLTNKNNLLIAELNQTKLLLEGKNTQYNTLLEEIENYKINTKILRLGINTLASERDRYRKALEEIEEVLKICVNGDCVKCSLRNASLSCVLTIQTNILDIINKVKGE